MSPAQKPSQPTTSNPAIAPGTCIRDYEVISCLGAGGMGRVFRVRHLMLGTEHALKLPFTSGTGQAPRELRFRFIQEARVTASLRHPFINRATDLFEWQGQLCMVSDIIHGERIDRWVRSHQPGRAARLGVLIGICDAVSVAHEAQVLHRDLTAQNIMIDFATDSPRLLDFGICQDLEAHIALTRAGVVVGNLDFLAPELIRGERPTVRSEVYQLALVARMVLDPDVEVFPRCEGDMHLNYILNGWTNPMSDHVSPALQSIVRRGMARHPQERYATVAELRGALATELAHTVAAPTGSATASPPAEHPIQTAGQTTLIGHTRSQETLTRSGGTLTRWLIPMDDAQTFDTHGAPGDRSVGLSRWAPILIFGLFFLGGLFSLFVLGLAAFWALS